MKIRLFMAFLFLSSCAFHQKNIQKSDYHHKIAIGLVGKCDRPRALSHLLKAIQLNPKSFLIRHTLAIVYYAMGQYDLSVAEFKKILKNKPDFTPARVALARAYIDLNQPDLSLKELARAEKDITYTNYLKIVSQKALAFYKQGQYGPAKKWFEEAFSLPKGKSCFVYLNLGKTEMFLGNLSRSEELLKKALSVCQEEKLLCRELAYKEHLALAQLYIQKKDKKRAKYHLNLFLLKSKEKREIEKAKKLLKKIS